MSGSVDGLRQSPLSCIAVALLLILSLAGGAGVAVADQQDDRGRECPGENPSQGAEHADQTAVTKSRAGRVTALEATGCL